MLERGLKFVASMTILLMSHQSLAQSSTPVYGPEVFKASIAGIQVTKTFKAKSNADGFLILVNGDGTNLTQAVCSGNLVQKLVCVLKNLTTTLEVALTRPQSVEVSLNGKKIVSSSNFKSESGRLLIPIKTLTGAPVNAVPNTLLVKVKGSPLAQIKLEISVQNPAPTNQLPIAQFSFNPNNSLAPALVSFSGVLSHDPNGSIVSYAWIFGDGGTATGPIVTHMYSNAGSYTVRLTVTDNQGASASISQLVTVISDTTAPIIASMNERFIVRTVPGSIQVFLTASEILASATVGGSPLVINGTSASGSVQVTQSGNVVLPVVIRDVSGNTTTESRTFNIIHDQFAPIIATTLQERIITNQNSINVPVNIIDESNVMTTLSLSGVQLLSTQNMQFSYNVNLTSEGEQILLISSIDEAGRTSQKQISILKDSVAPVLSNIQPADGSRSNSRLVVVTGNVSEMTNITVNGTAATVSNGTFSANVRAMREGNFSVVIQATDSANNQTSSTINIMIDTGSDRLWTYEECPVDGGGL